MNHKLITILVSIFFALIMFPPSTFSKVKIKPTSFNLTCQIDAVYGFRSATFWSNGKPQWDKESFGVAFDSFRWDGKKFFLGKKSLQVLGTTPKGVVAASYKEGPLHQGIYLEIYTVNLRLKNAVATEWIVWGSVSGKEHIKVRTWNYKNCKDNK